MEHRIAVESDVLRSAGRTCGEVVESMSGIPRAVSALGDLPFEAGDPVAVAWRAFTAATGDVLASWQADLQAFGRDLESAAGTYRSVDGAVAGALDDRGDLR